MCVWCSQYNRIQKLSDITIAPSQNYTNSLNGKIFFQKYDTLVLQYLPIKKIAHIILKTLTLQNCSQYFRRSSRFLYNRLYTLTANNSYIESNIQKGFCENISDCVEHIETLLRMTNNVRTKWREIPLIDLRNALDEVNRNLLVKTVKIPDNQIATYFCN